MVWLALEVRPFSSTSRLFFIPDKTCGEFDLVPSPLSAANAMVVDAMFPATGTNIPAFSSDLLSVTPGQLVNSRHA